MPQASDGIREQLNIKDHELSWDGLGKLSILSGHKINEAKLLFKKIENDELKSFKERFSGKQVKRILP